MIGHRNTYEAFGLNYQAKPAEYSLVTLQQYSSQEYYQQDKAATEAILNTWLAQTRTAENPRPKMVLTCASGGGLRAALWTTVALQTADSVTNGKPDEAYPADDRCLGWIDWRSLFPRIDASGKRTTCL